MLQLKPHKEKSLLNKHPWVFSGALAKPPQVFSPSIDLYSADSTFLGTGYYNPDSQIAMRVLRWDQGPLDLDFFCQRIKQAAQARDPLRQKSNALRLIASEADGLPGLIVDQYVDTLVLQCLTAGMEAHLPTVIEALKQTLNPVCIYERSDDKVRAKEGLESRTGVVYGTLTPQPIQIREGDYSLLVNVETGHKTGYYLDQRNSRMAIQTLSQGKSLLNCFSYTGGFSVAALVGGASSVTSVDVSQPALDTLDQALTLNSFTGEHTALKADVFEALREQVNQGQRYDMIILDPPKFVNARADLKRASRGYKDINRLAFKLLKHGGLLATFSCSGHMSADLFQKIVFSAAIDAGCDGQIIQHFHQAEDHPIRLTFPESEYLKGLLVRKG